MNLQRGKEILTLNYGSKYFMERNGEYSEYLSCKIPKDTELEWKEQIKQSLITKIINVEDLSLIWNLSCMDIPYAERLSAFEYVVANGNREAILNKMISLKKLFNKEFYNDAKRIFDKI